MEQFISRGGIRLNATVNAEEVAKELTQLGDFTPSDVVDAARSPSSALHKYFEWDNGIAADAYRLTQARNLILSVEVIESGTRAFERVCIDSSYVYVPMSKVVASRELTSQVIEQAYKELLYWRAKHQKYKTVFGGIFDAIDEAGEAMRKHGNEKGRSRKRDRNKVRNPADKKIGRGNNNSRRLSASR